MLDSLLNAVGFSLLEQGYKIGLDWLGQFARVIIEGVGIVGLGIIVFTLVLKAITLPFDIYQRVKMRKQTLIMRDMKDDLEKLQKQYANDKGMYSQKMLELYKKNGYSMLGACLPMIISIVILIVAFQGFNAYSRYANLDSFVNMSGEYNAAILEHGVVGPNFDDVLLKEHADDLDRWVIAKPYRLTHDEMEDDEYTIAYTEGSWTEDGVVYRMYQDGEDYYLEVRAEDETRYLYYFYNLKSKTIAEEYRIDTDKLLAIEKARAAIEQMIADAANADTPEDLAVDTACQRYVVRIGATAAKEWYKGNNPGFLWVNNVWYPDVSYNHPIPSYSTFKSQLGNSKVTLLSGDKKPVRDVLTEPLYNNLTSELTAEKSAPNGYFILIILSIGLMVLSQFIMMKSQKESNQYQTVDGQGARTQKIMLVMMPLIYAIFAFMYSAAFSIYMMMSSLISLIVTLLSNLSLGRVFKKKEETRIKEQYGRTLPWMKKEEGDKNNKKRRK